ncbi:MAG TPA: DUF393 domain-containing protein [Desulfuromonadaceae bacterium]
MADIPAFPLQVFFDGSCPLCAGEMEKYRAMEHDGRLLFVNIKAPRFDPTPYGITMDEFMHEMHCIDRDGRVFRGVEGFRAIWLAFPASRWYAFLARLVGFPGVNLMARLMYRCLARLR